MKLPAIAAAAAALFAVTTTAHAEPVSRATAIPLAIKMEWASSRLLINAVRLDCRIHDPSGKGVGRGSFETRIDPVFLSRRGSVKAVMGAVIYKGTDPDEGLTCSCRARLDTRHPFFIRNSGGDNFGQRPWMFARPYRFAETSCAPLETRPEATS
jgi:hypothetical protein